MRTSPLGQLTDQASREQEVLAAQLELLYRDTGLGLAVTLIAASILAALQWRKISQPVALGWWIGMILLIGWRYVVALRFRRSVTYGSRPHHWRNLFTLGAALGGMGWGVSAFLLYPPGELLNQIFLLFVIGGMMLGGASLLAPRPEAFAAFLLPAGLAPTFRLFLDRDQIHLGMATLTLVFTTAMLIAASRTYRTLDASLHLQLENRDLVQGLQRANRETEAINQALEQRVQQRTSELERSAQQLRAEMKQREQAEEELLRARKLESLGVLAGGIAHDFNNFLTVVQGNIEVAKARLDGKNAAVPYLDQAANACQRAAFLSSQLLTFAKGGAPVRRVASMADLIQEAVQFAAAGSSIRIETAIADDLWCAYVDPGQISQVLHNVLLNARQATPGAGVIHVQAENIAPAAEQDASQAKIRIAVRDHGCGIAAEAIRRIFDPYFTTKQGGNGLGLTTAYAIVSKHAGHISAQSTPGEGATFTIELPALRGVSAADAAPADRAQKGSGRLLVMDDEQDLLTVFQAVLNQLGYEVETARDGNEAIARYIAAGSADRSFDAVLLDLTVSGGMGGLETAKQLRELDPSAKLIVSSGYSDAPVMSNFSEYGFAAVLLKPWRVSEISDVLRQVLAG
jgi:signal transduction histidine kinase/ActR/RegA family two-component response regulator